MTWFSVGIRLRIVCTCVGLYLRECQKQDQGLLAKPGSTESIAKAFYDSVQVILITQYRPSYTNLFEI